MVTNTKISKFEYQVKQNFKRVIKNTLAKQEPHRGKNEKQVKPLIRAEEKKDNHKVIVIVVGN